MSTASAFPSWRTDPDALKDTKLVMTYEHNPISVIINSDDDVQGGDINGMRIVQNKWRFNIRYGIGSSGLG